MDLGGNWTGQWEWNRGKGKSEEVSNNVSARMTPWLLGGTTTTTNLYTLNKKNCNSIPGPARSVACQFSFSARAAIPSIYQGTRICLSTELHKYTLSLLATHITSYKVVGGVWRQELCNYIRKSVQANPELSVHFLWL